METLRLHASCVCWDGAGILLRGDSGCGKSDLALRLWDLGALIVSDDQTLVRRSGQRLMASGMAGWGGVVEVRGAGFVRLPHQKETGVDLVVDLRADPESAERIPTTKTVSLLDCPVKSLRLWGFAASAPALIRAALTQEWVDHLVAGQPPG